MSPTCPEIDVRSARERGSSSHTSGDIGLAGDDDREHDRAAALGLLLDAERGRGALATSLLDDG
jgi:hypothetical protein